MARPHVKRCGKHLTDDAGLLKDFAEVAAFGAVIVAGGPLAPAAFVALVVKTAGASIAAATRVLGRLSNSGDPAPHRLPNTYERFRVMFYVACQRAYLGAIESNFATISKLAKKSKIEKSVIEHARKALEQTVAQVDEAEVRFRYSLDPADEPLPLFKAYGEWVSAALVVAMPDYAGRSEFVSRVQEDAIKRLHVALAADDDAALWMRRYLALQRDTERAQAVRTDLASIRHALDGWLEAATGKRQREEAWRSYREMLQALPDARETMFNEEFRRQKGLCSATRQVSPRWDVRIG